MDKKLMKHIEKIIEMLGVSFDAVEVKSDFNAVVTYAGETISIFHGDWWDTDDLHLEISVYLPDSVATALGKRYETTLINSDRWDSWDKEFEFYTGSSFLSSLIAGEIYSLERKIKSLKALEVSV